jgi:hypothetical protein
VRGRGTRRGIAAAALTALTLVLGATGAQAKTYTVTSKADDGPGTLHAAITKSNTPIDTPDKIVFKVTGTIKLKTALPGLFDDVKIKGPGANRLAVDASDPAYPDVPVFFNDGDSISTISGLEIRGADVQVVGNAQGGGIRNYGQLVLDRVWIHGNTATAVEVPASTVTAMGGGVYNGGYLRLRRSTLSDNLVKNVDVAGSATRSAEGGGLFTYDSSQTTVEQSTIANNRAEGLSAGSGGGVMARGYVNLNSDTIAGNEAKTNTVSPGSGANVAATSAATGQAAFRNTVVDVPSGGATNCSGSMLHSNDFNAANDPSCAFTQTNDLALTGLEVGLRPLGSYGGTMPTMPPNSPDSGSYYYAVDNGNDAFSTDQRGKPRPVDLTDVNNHRDSNGADKGAVELQ